MSEWVGKQVLCTGAGGFIGSHLAERLVREGARVRAMVHYRGDGSRGWLDCSPLADRMEVVAGDIRDPEFVRVAVKDCDVVYHLAALPGIPYSYAAPRSYVETNVVGTLNVLLAAMEYRTARVVQTSTSEVYGSAAYTPQDEQHPLCGQSPYSASKIAADKLAQSFYHSFGTPVVTLRPFNTFGPRQSARAIVPTIIAQALAGGPIRLGNLAPTRDLNYVDNTVDAFLLAGSVPGIEGRTINAGSGREVTIGELAELICWAVDQSRDFEVTHETERCRPANSEVDRLCCDNRLARELLGWQPRLSLEEGLARTIEWMRANAGRYRAYEYAV